ncbi:hypothetical protein [Amycolatopsis sp. CA-230715]|uniref:hypothetical protein n=1 Tax=Amycolatopsis sp. CA-230715 TaxID=2745196 RepID=UPI001C037DE7|nr:hypothetical protein [Amycolatopsis sp. CA-230715]QWF85772.1 hypothetical protein HUW46_09252 [Amycolatopsis sp. CA-230715]
MTTPTPENRFADLDHAADHTADVLPPVIAEVIEDQLRDPRMRGTNDLRCLTLMAAEINTLLAAARAAGNSDTRPPRELLGRWVRQVWEEWAREQANAKPSWLTPWENLDDGQREVDMRIGDMLFEMGRRYVILARHCQADDSGADDPELGWAVTVEIPGRVSAELKESLLNGIADVVDSWQPQGRDWDAMVSGAPADHTADAALERANAELAGLREQVQRWRDATGRATATAFQAAAARDEARAAGERLRAVLPADGLEEAPGDPRPVATSVPCGNPNQYCGRLGGAARCGGCTDDEGDGR